jgi:hypothetical protein
MTKSLAFNGAVRSAYGQVFDLAGIFGCSLNGVAARLDVSQRTGLAEVKTVDGQDRAVYNWSVATQVMQRRKGQFVTRDNQEPVVRRWA